MAPQRLTQPATLAPSVAALLDEFVLRRGQPLPIFAALAHSPLALEDLAHGTQGAINGTTLPIRQREILILRTLARWNARAEWDIHVLLYAQEASLSTAELATIGGAPQYRRWNVAERLLLDVADSMRDSDGLEQNLWDALSWRFTAKECAEVLMIATQYIKVALLTRALAIPSLVPAGPDFKAPIERAL